MIAVQLEQGRVEVVQRPKPRRRPGFAVMRLLCGGICNTGLELQRGYYGFRGIPGHEFIGEVVEAENPRLLGRRVVGEINLACGHCDWCRSGMGRHCPRRTVLGIVKHPGAFRELIDLPETNLLTVPRAIPTEQAVFTEPLAAACEILDQVKIPEGETVAVLGDGKLGLLIAQVLQLHGAHVHQFGRHREKLRIAAATGVETMMAEGGLPRSEYRLTVEATGSAEGLRQAVAMTRPRGTVVMKSTVHEDVAIDMAPVIVNEISLVGSRCGRFQPALRLLASGKLNLEPMIAGRFPLSEAAEGFACAATKGVLKVLLTA
jgi:alcohol dehydrogenase